jgi:hypothetical protein
MDGWMDGWMDEPVLLRSWDRQPKRKPVSSSRKPTSLAAFYTEWHFYFDYLIEC